MKLLLFWVKVMLPVRKLLEKFKARFAKRKSAKKERVLGKIRKLKDELRGLNVNIAFYENAIDELASALEISKGAKTTMAITLQRKDLERRLKDSRSALSSFKTRRNEILRSIGEKSLGYS